MTTLDKQYIMNVFLCSSIDQRSTRRGQEMATFLLAWARMLEGTLIVFNGLA